MPPFKPTTPDAFGIDPDAVYRNTESALFKDDVEFLNTPELAKALQVTEAVVRQMIGRRAVPTYRISGKILFRRTDILAYLDQKEQPRPTTFTVPAHAWISRMPCRTYTDERPYGTDDLDELCAVIGPIRELSPKDPTVRWYLVECSVGQVLLVHRTYRDGVGFILNPADEALIRYRTNVWMAWNDSRVLRF